MYFNNNNTTNNNSTNNNNQQNNSNPQFQGRPSPLRVIHDRKPTVDIIAGRNPVLEALRSGRLIEKVVILSGVKGSAIGRIRQMAKKNQVPLVEVGKFKFRELVSDTTTQGVVAIVGTKKYVEVNDIIKKAEERNAKPFILILDEIEDPQNLGALIRTAECAGVQGVVVPKHKAASINQTVVKTSAGASEHMLAAKVTNVAVTIDELKKKGIWVIGTDANAEKNYTDIDYTGPIAIVVGNEGKGIRQLVKEKCDFIVKIPLYGKISSLNVSVAGALIMYEVVRQRNLIGKPENVEPQVKPEVETPVEKTEPTEEKIESDIPENTQQELNSEESINQ
jgi:23S rRNA (guanosine2251-2'-O)-methyltransferase